MQQLANSTPPHPPCGHLPSPLGGHFPSTAAQCLAEFAADAPRARLNEAVNVSFRGPEGRVGNRDHHTHLVHWFPAKMFHRIPIDILDSVRPPEGGQILDPFCGSGTVLVEGRARGFRTVGLDVNPLSCLISKVKTTSLPEDAILSRLDTITKVAKSLRRVPDDQTLPPFWFNPEPRKALYRLLGAIDEVTPPGKYRNFFRVSLSSIVRRCSLADPNIPPLVRFSSRKLGTAGDRYRRAYERSISLNTSDVYCMYDSVARKNAQRVAKDVGHKNPRAKVHNRSAMHMKLPTGTVDTVITSPPYCGAQKYVRTFKLELALLGHSSPHISKIDRNTLGTERVPIGAQDTTSLLEGHRQLVESVAACSPQRASMLSAYIVGLGQFGKELDRVLHPQGNAFITLGTGTISKIQVNFANLFAEIASEFRLQEVLRLTDRIPSRGMITKRHESAAVMPTETLLWLRRH